MSETALKIRLYGERILRKKATYVKEITLEQRNILSKMAQVMYENSGIGLAAPQVGISECMIVVDIGQGLYKLINPKILKREGSQVMEEGCLSVPGICVKVRRAAKVLLKAQDEFGKPIQINAEGLLACVFQHEIDHLRGRLIVDRASLLKRLQMIKNLEELAKKEKFESLPKSETKSCKLQL